MFNKAILTPGNLITVLVVILIWIAIHHTIIKPHIVKHSELSDGSQTQPKVNLGE